LPTYRDKRAEKASKALDAWFEQWCRDLDAMHESDPLVRALREPWLELDDIPD